jgi:hypothetical protein
MDSSRLLEIRMREQPKVIHNIVPVDASIATFNRAARSAKAVVSQIGTSSGSHVPTTSTVLQAHVGNTVCGQTLTEAFTITAGACGTSYIPSPDPMPKIPCTCVSERRFVANPKCGCQQ